MTFAAGSQAYLDAVKRITEQAHSVNLFDSVEGLTDLNLKADHEFWNKHGHFIETSTRGYGYWLWKPYCILKKLRSIEDGDILMYADSGCELDASMKHELTDYIEHVKRVGLWGTYGTPWDFSNDIMYCKRDTSLQYDLDIYALQKGHIQGSVHIILKCEHTMNLIQEWYSMCENYQYINDEPSVEANFPEFRDHRHDQSIYNLILKKYNLQDQIEYKGPVNFVRILHNRSGTSILS